MAWESHTINSYSVVVGSKGYYGRVLLHGKGFFAFLQFRNEGPHPNATVQKTDKLQRFTGSLDYQQMQMMVDLLRNESPVRFSWFEKDPNRFHLFTGHEPVGEGDGILPEDVA